MENIVVSKLIYFVSKNNKTLQAINTTNICIAWF